MKTWQTLLFGVLFGLAAAGLVLLLLRQPQGEPIQLLPPPTPAPLTVHVAGAVASPGVYTLSQGSRVEQAIQAAGGATEVGDLQALNLAALVGDGDRVWVPSRSSADVNPVRNEQPSQAPSVEQPLNINTASLDELDTLPGIGPAKAQEIVSYRQSHGLFTTIEDIQAVPGIGEVLYQGIKDLITVGIPVE